MDDENRFDWYEGDYLSIDQFGRPWGSPVHAPIDCDDPTFEEVAERLESE